MGQLRIGTCSWKFPSWSGLVYSKARGTNYLAEYAKQYDTVEIDQWFWSLFYPNPAVLPRRETVHEYLDAVAPQFRFTVKVPNSITLTHYYQRETGGTLIKNPSFLSVDLYQEFLRRVEPMLPQIGAFLFQFEYLNRKKMPGLPEFLTRLRRFLSNAPQPVPIAIEPRNPQYFNARYYQFLAEQEVYPVFAQGYYLPNIRALYDTYRDVLPNLVLVRLLGYDREAVDAATGKRWDARAIPRDEELVGIAAMIDDMLARGAAVYVNVNNHFEGSAPLTIGFLKQQLGYNDHPREPGDSTKGKGDGRL